MFQSAGWTIRAVTPADASAVVRVYNHYVTYVASTHLTFVLEAAPAEDIVRRLQSAGTISLRWLAVYCDWIAGYADASQCGEVDEDSLRVEANIQPTNRASIAFLVRAGFQKEGSSALGDEARAAERQPPTPLGRRKPGAYMPMIEARLVDITTLAVDAIVNAANTALTSGGGVCGAIHRAAGPELAEACSRVAPCPTGQARLTPGFGLQARYVIHAVGPVWRGGHHDEPALLASAYRSAIRLAQAEGLRSLAFPAISTGIYGYPLVAATRVAVSTVRRELEAPGSLTDVVFACFNREVLDVYDSVGLHA